MGKSGRCHSVTLHAARALPRELMRLFSFHLAFAIASSRWREWHISYENELSGFRFLEAGSGNG